MEAKNIKLIVSYDGSGYAGWQRLKEEESKKSIQSVLEEALSLVLKENIKVTGSGRTDKGVHAIGQAANFKCHTNLSLKEMQRYINEILPEDIKVTELSEVSMDFHSRKSAIAKTYEYRFEVDEVPSVFLRKYVCQVGEELDLSPMEKAAGLLTGTHDFRAFSSEKRENYDTVRRIDSILIEPVAMTDYHKVVKQVRILITGNGFLYNMVRIIAGTLLEIGLHKREAEDINCIFQSKRRENAGITLPPQGLYMKEVIFPVEINFNIK
ncbi:tRNA pseudouridine(38-40) synthase TruA [Anaerocolumna xylanovorans]|uniref:tRNA pseudouridine synthase A n=1 Tax=Anaerocolumna xylanovorans DSM 12503 TaxID=1121345 RepID=A0A1M7Y6G1_9FIRM|nr:tRNA pseudouridine(38-40) synthase TruA [Anaerocolumna xylanovorans]SHO48222.1 tRNA pseudouridine38-40 synthase [Anaerocolumna xylanovorans DSM 12503]